MKFVGSDEEALVLLRQSRDLHALAQQKRRLARLFNRLLAVKRGEARDRVEGEGISVPFKSG